MYGLDLLLPVVLLLSAGVAVIIVSRQFHVSPIVGFVLAGVVLGPEGLGVIPLNDTTKLLAELGVVFLLFDIGLHFSYKSIWKLRQDLLFLAPLQMTICAAVLGFAVAFISNIGAGPAVLAGLALALSSTAVVMHIVTDQKQGESPIGQSAKSVLIFQDIVAIFLLIFVDAAGSGGALSSAIGLTLIKTLVAFGAAIFLGRRIISPVMRALTRYDDPELFTLLALLIVILTGALTASVGLSLTLGAFLAGMVLSETPFRPLLQTELRPFRSILLALFFIKVGMILNPAVLWADIDIILGLVLLLFSVKAAIIGALTFIFRRPAYRVLQLAFLLAQGSEFAFVVFSMSHAETLLGSILTQQLIAAIAVSMLLTPFIYTLARRWSMKVCDTMQGIANCPAGTQNPVTRQPVLIVGMNEVGKTLARGMRAHEVPYIAIDSDRTRFLEATTSGYIVAYGKTSDLRFWKELGVDQARAVCLSSPSYEVAIEAVPMINKLFPRLKRYVAVNDSADGVRFASLGMTPFHNKGEPPGLNIATMVLRDMGFEDEALNDWIEEEHSAWMENHKKKPDDEEKTEPEAA